MFPKRPLRPSILDLRMGRGSIKHRPKIGFRKGSRRPFIRPSQVARPKWNGVLHYGRHGKPKNWMGCSVVCQPHKHTTTQPPNHRTTQPLVQPHTQTQEVDAHLFTAPSHELPKADEFGRGAKPSALRHGCSTSNPWKRAILSIARTIWGRGGRD